MLAGEACVEGAWRWTNPEWGEGIASSLHVGADRAQAPRPDVEAVCVGLADQPSSAPRPTGGWRGPPASSTVPVYDGEPGNPVKLARSLWPEASELRGDVGARALARDRAVDGSTAPTRERRRRRHPRRPRTTAAGGPVKIEDSFRVEVPVDEAWKVLARPRAHRPLPPRRAAHRGGGRRVPRHGEDQGRSHHRGVQGRGQDRRGRRGQPQGGAAGRGPRHARTGQRVRRRSSPPWWPTASRDHRQHRHRPQHHRQGGTVRAGRDGRRVEQAARPVRRQPQEGRPQRHRPRRGAADEAPTDPGTAPTRARCDERRATGVVSGTASAVDAGFASTGEADAGPRKIESKEAEPIDLMDAAGGSVGKRLAPIVAGVVVRGRAPLDLQAAQAALEEPPQHPPRRRLTLVGSNPCSIQAGWRGEQLVLGIDPGVSRCGYGVVRRDGSQLPGRRLRRHPHVSERGAADPPGHAAPRARRARSWSSPRSRSRSSGCCSR